jgi:hypothetical protein
MFFNVAMAENRDEAVKKTTEALSKTEMGKQVTKTLEDVVNRNLPVEKDTAAVIGSVAVTAAQGKVDTKAIKNMDISVIKGSVRPDVEYDFKEKNSSITLKYDLSF